MFEEGLDFKQALIQAQQLGFAESNPKLDVEGYDAVNKWTFLLMHAYGITASPDEILFNGIQDIHAADASVAREKNQAIKLIAQAQKLNSGQVAAFVLPQFVRHDDHLAFVKNEYNGVVIESGFADKFYPKAYQAFSRDGKQYGLPQSFSDVVLFYNKDLFDAAKVAYPTAEWTWKEELDAAQKLTDSGKGVWGDYAPIQFFEFYKTAAQSGCGVFGADGKTVTINEKGCVDSLTWMVDKINKYKVTPTDAEMAGVSDGDLFKQGKIAMLRTGIWMFSAFKDAPFKWDIALEPGNTQKAHAFFANSVAIAASSKNQEAAWKWAQFFTGSDEAAKIRVAASWELPALNNKALFDEYLKQTPPETRQVVFDALASAVTPPVTDKQSELQDMIGKLLDQAKAGSITPQEALDQAKTQIEALVK